MLMLTLMFLCVAETQGGYILSFSYLHCISYEKISSGKLTVRHPVGKFITAVNLIT
jgi:hypothetical protein